MPGSRTVSSRVRNAGPGSEGETCHAPASRSSRPGPAPPPGPRVAPGRRRRRRRRHPAGAAGLGEDHAVNRSAGPSPRVRLPELAQAQGRGRTPPGVSRRSRAGRLPRLPDRRGRRADRGPVRGPAAAAADPGRGAGPAARARPGDGTGPQDYRVPGLPAPDLRRGAGDHEGPGGPGPAPRRRRAGWPAAERQGHRRRRRDGADSAEAARGHRRGGPRPDAARLRGERGTAPAAASGPAAGCRGRDDDRGDRGLRATRTHLPAGTGRTGPPRTSTSRWAAAARTAPR